MIKAIATDLDGTLFYPKRKIRLLKTKNRKFLKKLDENDIEIVLDEYPFGLCIEIENKSKNKNPEEVVKSWVEKIGFDINKAYRLSWDDKYGELCKMQNKNYCTRKFIHIK